MVIRETANRKYKNSLYSSQFFYKSKTILQIKSKKSCKEKINIQIKSYTEFQ